MDLIELLVGLPMGVLAVYVHTDDARMLLLAQDGQHEIIEAIRIWANSAGSPNSPGLTVITRS